MDLSDDTPRLLESSVYDAQYVSARLVDGTVRLVTTTRPQPLTYYPTVAGRTAEQQSREPTSGPRRAVGLAAVLPAGGPHARRRDGAGARQRGVLRRTFHARAASGASTLLVTTLRPADGLAATDRTAVTTDGDLVYASEDRLYVATSRWGTVGPTAADSRTGSVRPQTDEVSTELHAFDTPSTTGTPYVGSGTVPGYVPRPVGTSSYQGALRVATTRQPPWNGNETGPPPRWWSSWSSGTVRWSRPVGSAGSAGPNRSGRCATSATSRPS